ncbi:hypothetical protein H8959_007898 [Pygathrix nigripes]
MFSLDMIISDPAAEASRAGKKQLRGVQNPCSSARAGPWHKSLSIKDKISEWEGKKEVAAPAPSRRADAQGGYLTSCLVERRSSDGDPEPGQDLSQPDREVDPSWSRGREPRLGKLRFQNDHLSVLKQVKKLEQALKDGSAGLDPQLPGTCYSPHCPPEKAEAGPTLPENLGGGSGSEVSQRVHPSDLEGREPVSEAVEDRKGSCRRPWDRSLENVYRGSEGSPTKPFINPLPKPRRTFKHAGEGDKDGKPGIGFGKEKRNLPPLPSLPPPPLPSSPPPSSVNRRLWTGRQKSSADHRKSYEFEDLLQSSSESSRVDWYAQTKLGLTRTLSEENVYEDILDPPVKENPYEDIELHGRCLGKKCVLNFPASPTSSIPDTLTKQSLSKPAFFRQNSERRNFKLLDTRKLSRDGTGSPSKISPPSTPSSPD